MNDHFHVLILSMDEMYGLHSSAAVEYSDKALLSPENLILPSDYQALMSAGGYRESRLPVFASEELISVSSAVTSALEIQCEDDSYSVMKAKIANHPRYPRLLQAYIDCQKVGTPPEIARLLDEIRRESDVNGGAPVMCLGADPELDEFMETYCDLLVKYKTDLSRPFDEATEFLHKIETQLSNLCKGSFVRSASDEGTMSSDEEYCGEIDVQDLQPRDEERDLKDRLLRKFGSHISSLKVEFSKKKKIRKLPKDARQTLLEWWNTHDKWPYPTEADKIALAEATGLDQRQINNWFINQRKRHWKPSENMHLDWMDNLTAHYFPDNSV